MWRGVSTDLPKCSQYIYLTIHPNFHHAIHTNRCHYSTLYTLASCEVTKKYTTRLISNDLGQQNIQQSSGLDTILAYTVLQSFQLTNINFLSKKGCCTCLELMVKVQANYTATSAILVDVYLSTYFKKPHLILHLAPFPHDIQTRYLVKKLWIYAIFFERLI